MTLSNYQTNWQTNIQNNLHCVAFNHHCAPVEIREQLKSSLDEVVNLWQDQDLAYGSIQELFLLSTCNRTELYAWYSPPSSTESSIARHTLLVQLLAQANQVPTADLEGYFDYHQGGGAIQHIHEVGAGLDSQVLGEPQILGQLSEAFLDATSSATVGKILTPLCQSGIRAGKRARTETAISRNPASISSVALTLAQKVMGDLQQQKILIIGAGDMAQLTLKTLQRRGITQIGILNRTPERAIALAERYGGQAYDQEQLVSALGWADVVISATSAPNHVIDVTAVQSAMATRHGRDLALVDIAVPRDIEPEVSQLADVHRFDVDALRSTLDQAHQARLEEVPKVEAILQQVQKKLHDEYNGLAVQPVIVELRRKAEDIRQRELERTRTYLGSDVDPQTWDQFQHFSRALVNKLLHEPTQHLRISGKEPEKAHHAQIARELFGLAA